METCRKLNPDELAQAAGGTGGFDDYNVECDITYEEVDAAAQTLAGICAAQGGEAAAFASGNYCNDRAAMEIWERNSLSVQERATAWADFVKKALL